MKTFITSFLENAKKYADNKAVADAKGCYTYRELDEKSNLVAAEIVKRAKTLGKDIVGDIEAGKNGLRVGVLFPRVKDFMVAVIGVMRAGCTFIPIDDSYPIERIRSIVEDSGCSFIVTTSAAQEKHELLSGLKLKADQYILIEDLKSETGAVTGYNLARYDNEGAIYYTSGSTGKPKGVIHNHKVFSCCDYMGHSAYGMSAGETCACMAGFTFLASIIDLITPFYCGGCVYIINESEFTDLPKLHSLIQENNVQYMYMPPKLAVSFFDIYKDVSMKKIICAGEKLSKRPSTDAEVLEYYGSTEDFLVLGHKVDKDENPGLLGKPTTKCRMYLVDDNNQQITQPGVSGELCAVSEYLALGYNNDPEKTAEKFVTCPFEKNKVMFRSGDLMSLTEDGSFKFHGRKDNMVKLNGYRVELEGVEAVIAKSDSVKEAACAMVTVDGKTVLGCYYVEAENCNNFSLEALKEHAARFMPYYMVPSVFMPLDRLPRNKNGKLDRKALPEFKLTAGEKVPPATENEKKLFELACIALNTDNFGVTTNLVSMGLNSLAAMRFCADLQKNISVAIRATDIMQCQTIRNLASFLEQQKGSTSELKKYALREYYPITENQRGIYLEWERDHDSLQYNLPRVYKFTDKNTEQLAEAVRKVVDVHSYLKTRIMELNGEIVQKPCWDEKPEVNVQNLEFIPDSDFFNNLIKPFSLLNNRLYRIEIFKSSEAVYLFTDFYHIIFDGLSYANFIRDVLAAYDKKEIVPEKLSAYDFALYEADISEKEAFNQARDYFDSLMADANTVRYPESLKTDGISLGSQKISIPAETINRFCNENSVTVSSYFQAVFAETLHRFTREENLFYVTVSNGRSASSELLNSTGMFVKTMPVVMKTEGLKHGDETTAEYVKRMHQQLQETYSREYFPYTKIAERSGLQAKVMFVYQGGILDNNGPEQIDLGNETAVFPLDVFAYTDSNGDYFFDFRYDPKIYNSHDIKQLADAVAVVAKNMASVKYIKQIRLLDNKQIETVMKLSKGEELDFDRSQTWIDLFKKSVASYPEHIAVADNVSSITYSELDKDSDKLAGYLVNNGVKPNDFVALKMDRVKEFVIAVVAVHKAGASYVPIALDYPEDRKAYMLEDSGAGVVLTGESVKEILKSDCSPITDYRTTPDNDAYMIYTSGSTGKPKGSRLHHRGLLNFIHSVTQWFKPESTDRISSHRAFSFDAHIEDLYPTLCAGAGLYIMPESIRKDTDAIYDFLIKNKITAGGYSTAIAKLLLSGYDLKQRYITAGGEALTDVTCDKVQIFNVYGPTECTDDTSIYKLEKGRHYEAAPIGRSIQNCYSFITDKYGQLVPQGIAGELCFAGPQVGYGYWHLDEKTKAVFEDCPFVEGTRMYHTGDLAKYNEEGNLEYIGRIDFQVKLRGFRIELGEIESRASLFEGVKQVLALVKTINGAQHLCLYYSANNCEIDKQALKAFLAETMADYMVPTVFMQVGKMPMTPNGKIDRRALPEPKIEREVGREPATELESKLCSIFAETLGLDKVYADESFFAVGGTSISAMKVVMKAMNNGIKFVYANIFDNPTPEALAKFIEGAATVKLESGQSSNEIFAPKEESLVDALKYNSIDYLEDISRSDIGNVLVTGANGFLGIHIVKKLLDNGCPVVYCLIRNGKNMSAETRLDMMFMYYFDETYSEMIGSRIRIINGDITDKSLEDTLKDVDYDTVINCAAVVKHFSNDDILDRVNFHGVENLVEICCKHNKKLVQVSTVSIAGKSIDNCVPMDFLMHENQHSFGQSLDSKYGRTKWLAEKAVLEAVQNRGLRGKVIRVGNLMSRASDGEFQANFRTNSFMNTLKAYNTLGCLPMANIVEPTEFSPIDSTAEAVITLAGTPDKFTVFHADNNHTVDMANVIDAMNACGLDIKIVKQAEFQKRFDEVMHDEKRNASISSLIAYLGNDSSRRFIASNNTFTLAVLNVLGFRWPIITEEYIEKAIKALKSMDFFD